MNNLSQRNRILSAFLVLVTMGVGLATRKYPALLPEMLGKYPGDAFWTLMVFFGCAFLMPKASSLRLAIFALAISWAVEFSQLYQASWINSIRGTAAGHLVFGSFFSWIDLLAYAIGALLGLALDSCFQKIRSGKNPADPDNVGH